MIINQRRENVLPNMQSLRDVRLCRLASRLPDPREDFVWSFGNSETNLLSASQKNCTFSVNFTRILYLWFRASLICINNCPTRCNTKQSVYYSASSLYMFRVSTTPIIRSTQNCNYSLRYCAATSLQRGQAGLEVAAQKIMTSIEGCSYSFVYSW